jgi:hypothetical protein
MGRLSDRIVNSKGITVAECCGGRLGPDGDEQDEANGLYIAAMSPDVAIQLCERLERAEAMVVELKAALKEADRHAVKVEKLLYPHIKWKHML